MTLRRVSKKRAALNRTVDPIRRAMREEIRRCEYCLRPASAEWLTLHEIARGVNRQKCLTARFGLLCVHWVVGIGVELVPCHANVQAESLARQLARLYLVRSSDYDLDAFHKLMARRFPSQEDVDIEIENLLDATRP